MGVRTIKRQSFVKGAMILAAANAVSKILGAVFKIPITYILKEEGMAIFNSAMQVYIMVLTLILCGTPIAVSKMVAERLALKKESDVHKIIRISEILLSVCGVLGSAVLFFGADFFAYCMKDSQIVYAVKAISPSVFFVSLGLVYKGYCQGTQNMIPTAVSQVTEAVIKLTAGYALAVYFMKCTTAVTSAGAVFGITVGEIAATFILLIMYVSDKRDTKNETGNTKSNLSTRVVVAELLKLAVPLTAATSVGSVLSTVDIGMIRSRLQAAEFTAAAAQNMLCRYGGFTDVFDGLEKTLRISDEGARWLYGAYSGYALTVFHLPPGIVGTLGVSILPVIAGAFAVGNMKKVSNSVQFALKIAVITALPCAVGMFILSAPILQLLFKNTASSQLLTVIAPCVVTVCVVTVSSSVLQAAGKVAVPFVNMLIGSAVKLTAIYFLTAVPEINILGAPIATNLDYLTIAVLDMYAVKKITGVKYDMVGIFVKPTAAVGVMGFIVWAMYAPILSFTGSNAAAVFTAATAGAAAYAIMLVLTGTIRMSEIKSLFRKI